jgi:uncharacterized protein YcbK (DUF882 family)
MPTFAWARPCQKRLRARSLSLFSPDTKESLSRTYWADGQYDSQALADISHIMRDWHTEEAKPIDTNLLDLLHAISAELNVRSPLHILSGYRTPSTNILLRKRGRPASSKSYHLKGKAADIRIPGYQLSVLRAVSMQLERGGVGYYPRSSSLHVDVGPIRYWSVF